MAYNVLIVDDSRVTRAMVAKIVRMSGLDLGEIYEAGNGREGLEQLEANWIDVVFADINMPEMTGIEMVDRMSQSGVLATTPVVIISTERSVTRIQELKAKGASAYLKKPFTPENVKAVIEDVLGAKPSECGS